MRQLLTVIVPFIAFAVVVGANYAKLNAEGTPERAFNDLPHCSLVCTCYRFLHNEKPKQNNGDGRQHGSNNDVGGAIYNRQNCSVCLY